MKKHVFTLLILLACILSPLHAYEYFTIYFSDGTKSEAFYAVDVDSICYSRLGLDSIEYANWQVQKIYTCDSVYRYPLTMIDSLSFKDVNEEKVAEDIDRANAYIVPHYLQCSDAAELATHLSGIKDIEGVENAWADHQTLFVKIRDYGTITYIYPPAMKASGIRFDYQKVRSTQSKLAASTSDEHHHVKMGKACIYNQAAKDENSFFDAARDTQEELYNMYKCMGITCDSLINLSPHFFTNEIFDYDHVFLITHGEYDEKRNLHWLYTSEELLRVDDENWINNVHAWLNFIIKNRTYSSDKIGIGVHKEIRNGKVCVVYYAKVSEKYIDSSSRQFKNTGNPIVFNTACQSLKNNDNMAEAFKRKGAGCYLGYTETNDIGHNGGEYFYANMLNAQCIGKAKESIPNDWQKETWINNKNEKISVELKKILLNDKADNICIIDPETLEAEIESDNGNESVTLKGQIKMLLPSLLDRYEMGFVLADNKEMNDTLHKPVSGDYDETARLMRFEKTLENSDLRSGKNYYQAYMYDGTSYCYGEIKSFTTKGDAEPYYVWDEVSKTATFYYDGMCYSRGGKDRNYTIYHVPYNAIRVVFDHSFALFHPKGFTFWGCSNLKQIDNIKYLNTDSITEMYYMFDGCSSLTSLDLSSFNTANVTDMNGMFFDCSSLTSLDLSSFNTANVTEMRTMFSGCGSLTSLNLSSFNTENVTDMDYMFSGCSSLTSLDLTSFNTTNVTSMYAMFNGCSSLTSLDLTSFNTTNVTSMGAMFDGCSSLTSLDLSCFNTANVTGMDYMFTRCSSLTSLDLSSFNTANVTGMDWMFAECSSLTNLDLSSFNTTNVTDMRVMFYGCSSLTSLDLSGFNTINVTKISSMFAWCSSLKTIYADNWSLANEFGFGLFDRCDNLVGGKGTKIGQNLYGYDENGNPLYYYCSQDCSAAHIDGGKDNPGLFTAK